MRKGFAIWLLFWAFIFCLVKCSAQTYQGFGSQVTGGAGMQTFHVTNLNATGTGSLYSLIGSNRQIVFDVSGEITGFSWDSSNEFAVKNLTIDGQGKITLSGNANTGNILSFQTGCSNIIVKNIRARNGGNDGINLTGSTNIVLDHVSSAGNRDGDIDITAAAQNISVTNCILGPGNSIWSGSMLIAYTPTKNISIYRNLFYSITPGGVGERNPLVHSVNGSPGSDLMCDFRNNLVYKWGRNNGTGSGYGSLVQYQGSAMFVNNYYYSGSDIGNAIVSDGSYGNTPGGSCFASGNISGNNINPNSASNHAAYPIPASNMISTMDACTAAAFVKSNAGCRPLDPIDQSIIDQIALTGCQSLPVLLSSFTYNAINKSLEWETETEINNDRFDVEESIDGIHWSVIGSVKTKAVNGNSDSQLKYIFLV